MQAKKIIMATAAFIMVAVCLFLAVDALYVHFVTDHQQLYLQQKSYDAYLADLNGTLNGTKTIDVAFFGASMTRSGINPRFIPGSFNFGTSAQNYIQTDYMFKSVLKDAHVKTVVLPVDQMTFSSLFVTQYLLDDLYLNSRYFTVSDVQRVKGISFGEAWIESHFPVIGNGLLFTTLIQDPEYKDVYLGWATGNEDFTKENMTDSAEKTYQFHFTGQEKVSNLSLYYYEQTLDLARANNITVVLIRLPLTKQYEDALQQNDFGDIYPQVFNVTDQHLRHYIVLDYHALFFDHPEYFRDAVHLNKKGAAVISQRICKDLLSYNITTCAAQR